MATYPDGFHSCFVLELAVGNMVRRVLYIIREEYMAALNTKMCEKKTSSEEPLSSQSMPSLQTILAPGKHTEFDIVIKELKQSIMEVIAELMEEFSCLHESISSQALEHIHANEVILTLGYSTTVRNFLATAAKKRDFKVIVVEGAPNFDGQVRDVNPSFGIYIKICWIIQIFI